MLEARGGGNSVKNRAMGIVRMSSHKQDRGNSPEVQSEGIRHYAADLGLDLIGTVTIHESAKDSQNRPRYNRAMAQARETAQHVIFWVWDRAARNFTDLENLERDVTAGKLVIHSASDRRALDEHSPSSEWMALEAQGLSAKQYARDLRRRAIESMGAKAKRGWYPTRAPMGYRNGGRGSHIELQPWGAAFIRRMYTLRLEGLSLKAIAEQIAREDLGVSQHELRGFRGTGRHKRVEQILKSPFYMGEFKWRGQQYQGKHEPVFTHAEWKRLQETFDGKHAPHRADQSDAALAGFLRCGECGCRITYDPKTKKSGRTYDYYRCANGRRAHARLLYVNESDVFDALEPALDAITIGPELADRIAAELNKTHADVKRKRRQEMERYKAALSELVEREDRLYERYDHGEIDKPTHDRQLERIRSDRTHQTAQLEQANEHLDDAYLFTAQRILELAQDAKTLWKSRSAREKRALLEELVSNPTLTGRSVRFDLKKPFAVLAQMRDSTEWHAQRDSNPRHSVPKTDALSS
jgi:site-specific DNA recombinase